MLRDRDILAPGFDMQNTDVYDPATYLVQKEDYDSDARLLADRNLLTRWINLTKAGIVIDEVKAAAALLTFCQCCGILVEPNIALYEVAAESGNGVANDEEVMFRVVDNADPRVLAEVTLGNFNNTPQSFITLEGMSSSKDIDFSVPLRMWCRNYVLVLKAAAIALDGREAETLIERLFEWMYSQYVFLAPSTVLALSHFSPNSPKKGLFKRIRSKDRERAIAGIKSAAWDLTLIHQWLHMVRGQKTDNTINLLGSLDRKLHTVARNTLVFTGSNAVVKAVRRDMFDRLWGIKPDTRLYSKIQRYYKDRENPARLANGVGDRAPIDDLILEGEQEIRKWHPSNRA